MSGTRKCLITDTSVLINFLAIDQIELLVTHPDFSFVVTDHVREEVTDYYPEQVSRLDAALSSGAIVQWSVNTAEEIEIFAALSAERRFGAGECAAIAAAVIRGCSIAIDDRAAIKHIGRLYPQIHIETTETIVVGMIRYNLLEVGQADAFKNEWETKHRFKLPYASFSDIL